MIKFIFSSKRMQTLNKQFIWFEVSLSLSKKGMPVSFQALQVITTNDLKTQSKKGERKMANHQRTYLKLINSQKTYHTFKILKKHT